MNKKQIHTRKELQDFRRELRKNMTPAEAFLWKCLRGKRLDGKKFQRQHSIDNYITDFYCASEKLIIELDGEVHNNPASLEYDQIRTNKLNELGFTVIRFENQMVFNHLPSVLEEIRSNFKNSPQNSSLY